jgi:hypothetical protein
MAVKLSALRTRRALLPSNIIIFMFLVLISVRGSVTQGLVQELGCTETFSQSVSIFVSSVGNVWDRRLVYVGLPPSISLPSCLPYVSFFPIYLTQCFTVPIIEAMRYEARNIFACWIFLGFQFLLGHGCMPSLRCHVCLAAGWSPVQGVPQTFCRVHSFRLILKCKQAWRPDPSKEE